MKPHTFLLGLMDRKPKKGHEALWYMTITERWYAQKWKMSTLSMEEWLVKMLALAEMARLTSLVREKTFYIYVWLEETKKNDSLMNWGFDVYKKGGL